jgi:hypothetical protein
VPENIFGASKHNLPSASAGKKSVTVNLPNALHICDKNVSGKAVNLTTTGNKLYPIFGTHVKRFLFILRIV